jgi:hypothetical protein
MQKALWAANRILIGLQLGISVISKRRQNCVELVKCFSDSPKAFRGDQRFFEPGG